jgi:AAA domain
VRIESVTAHAFGPLAGETLELAPGLTVVAGVNESAKSSWHAALYAALCGRRPDAATPTDRRLVERYKPWSDAPWLLSANLVLDDGRRLEICQDLDTGDRSRVVERGEDGAATDVTGEILAGGTPDASRWLGLDRSAFAAVALVNQAEHRAVRDAADGLQQYLRRATEVMRDGGSAESALTVLDRFLAERLGTDRTGPLAMAQERLRVAREARVVARRGHEQYLTDLATAGERRSAAGSSAERLRAAEQSVRALEQVAGAAGAAEEARAAADRSREALSAAAAACEEATRRSTRVAALRAQVPEQNSGPHSVTRPRGERDADVGSAWDVADQADAALLDTVTSARSAWDAAPFLAPLEGPAADTLRGELAGLPEDGVDPQVRTLADAHREALSAAAEHPAPPSARPSPRPVPAPAELRRVADALAAPPTVTKVATVTGLDVAELGSAVEAARARQRAATEAAETAERDAVAAEEHYQQLRATAAAADARRHRPRPGGRLRTLTLTVLTLGVGLAALYFGLLAALVVSALVILPVVVSLLTVVVVAVRAMKRAATGRNTGDGRPVVEDLVGAIVTVREKRAVAVRAREEARAAEQHAAECRARHVAALRGEQPDPAREQAVAWCTRHGLRADADALRSLAARTEEQAAQRDVERSRLAAAVASTGDALRAALRERGILDEGTPIEQFARYEAQARSTAAPHEARRAELERALAGRLEAEEAAAHAATARRDAVAQLRSAAGAVGLDPSGDPETLVRALDGWCAVRRPRSAVALADRPHTNGHGNGPGNGNGYVAANGNGHAGNGHAGNGHVDHGIGNGYGRGGDEPTTETAAELAALLAGGSVADLRRQEDDLRAVRDERLAQAWTADLEACEARRRRDELARAAGIDPVRAGDRTFVAALLDVARNEERQARAAVAEHGSTAVPAQAPAVARADEEVEAAESALRRMEQLRRTTVLTRRYLARAQEQTHRDVAPVLAATLREWLPGVTRGRYVDALVDPETLAVQVFGRTGAWRPVDRLSAGTADQVYLLLRVALAQHLAATGETCPLLLDGVTAQADGERATEILDLLLKLGGERQVVLFTQEDAVLRWAREHLDGDRHRVRELAPLPVA